MVKFVALPGDQAKYNGTLARVHHWHSEKKKFVVKTLETGEQFKLKAKNLELVEAAVANDTHISVRFQEMGISDFGRPDYALHHSSLHLL